MERNHFSNFGRGSSKEHSCEIILKSAHWPWGDVILQVFLFLPLVAICSGERNHFSNFGMGSSKEHSCEIILKSAQWPRRRCCLKGFSNFSSGGRFVQRSITNLAILVEGHPKIICVKLFRNRPIALGGDVVLQVFLFLALVAILFSGTEPF